MLGAASLNLRLPTLSRPPSATALMYVCLALVEQMVGCQVIQTRHHYCQESHCRQVHAPARQARIVAPWGRQQQPRARNEKKPLVHLRRNAHHHHTGSQGAHQAHPLHPVDFQRGIEAHQTCPSLSSNILT